MTVVYSPDAFDTLGGAVRTAPVEHENVHVRPLSRRFGPVTPLVTYLSGRPALRARELRELLTAEPFDVTHFHNVSLVGGPGVLAYGTGVKLYTTHEHWLVCPMHVLWKNNREPCELPKCLRCTIAFHRPPQLWRYSSLLDRQTQHVDMFLSPSRFTIAKHRERGFTGPMTHLPYFLPQQEAAEPAPAERPYFLAVGRLEKLKGFQTLIELFRRYDAADLVIAGDGTYGDELRRQATGLSHVRLVGGVPFYELQSLYAGATALIVPSIGYETFGIVTLEAFAQRTPAIVRDLGALPEAVDDSGGGFTYRSDAELLEAMEALRTNPGLRAELGERGYRGYLENWSEVPHVRGYLNAIEEARGGHLTISSRPREGGT